jgi:concentrative nucleoside transporter, CNT family
MQERVISAFGSLVLLGMAYLCCPRSHRAHVNLRTVGGGLALLLALALLVLKTPGRVVFGWASDAVDNMLEFSAQGAGFVFGSLVTDQKAFGFVFAFQVLPTIVFFGALMAILYHVRIMPFLIHHLGRLISRTLGTSGAESFSTVADIFVGQTEAPLVIRPYLATLTRSELMACMTAGFATTAGGVLAAYVLMLNAHIPTIAGHLISCSVMCAPASLVIAKLMLPETEVPLTRPARPIPAREAPGPAPGSTAANDALAARQAVATPTGRPTTSALGPAEPTTTGLLDAITTGTTDGLRLAINVGAMLVAFLGLTALVNAALGWVGSALWQTPLSLERIFGWLFAPLAWLMGVPMQDVVKVGSLLGQKTVLNEFVAYSAMSQQLARDPGWLTERSQLIASYALCGFANLGSIGIQIGGYSALAPERRADLASLGPKAMFAGLLTTCLVACIAGVLL